jgi:hypothetical protein
MLLFPPAVRVIWRAAICLAKPVDSFAKSVLRQVPHSLRNEAEDMCPVTPSPFSGSAMTTSNPTGKRKGIPMNHLTRLQIKTPPLLMTLALFCFGSLPKAQAVSPPPDGGYPGFNTAEGTDALKSLTTGVGDTAVGWFSLFGNTDGSFNTAVGAGTLLFNVGDQSTGEGVSKYSDWHGGAFIQHHRIQQHCRWCFGALEQHEQQQYGHRPSSPH